MEHQPATDPDAHLNKLFLIADEEPWYKSIGRSIRESLNPPKLPPLEITSKPIEGLDLGGMSSVEQPWYKSLAANVRDLISPPKLPPLEITSKPVEVGTIWGAYEGHQGRYTAISFVGWVGIMLVLGAVMQVPTIKNAIKEHVTLIAPDLQPYKPKMPPAAQKSGGGGGGGQKAPIPVSRGAAPKQAPKQFLPPTLVNTPKPLLPVVPTINAPAPVIVADNYGDPLSKNLALSGGQGVNGLGSGKGYGLGSGDGNGYGPGHGGGTGGGAYRIGGDVSAPQIISKMEPEYSEEARKAKYSGSVLLSIVVDANGMPRDIKVVRPLGLGLDEKAVEAVSHWRFRPGMKGGTAVATQAQVEVNFRLL